MIRNPILPGFNPDPSICRVGEDYYVATSTFEWYPGVQIHHSRDLVRWRLAARPLDRAGLLDMRGNPDSGGVWAPCLSFADGRFWLVYTDVKRLEGSVKDTHNYVTTCESVDGRWSDPIHVNSSGFDPSLFHDEDGRKWFLNLRWNHREPGTGANPANDRFDGILLQEWDPERGLLGEPADIFAGTERGLTEGPHLFKRGGWYYLTVAEGGTGYDHAVTMARAREIRGPYEVHPERHLVTAAHAPDHPIQRTGHGQYVETPAGEPYHTFLMSRPIPGPDGSGRFSPLGRETGIERCVWRDDWLYLEGGDLLARTEVPAPAGAGVEPEPEPEPPSAVHRDFADGRLPPEFQWLRTPHPERLFRVEPGAVVLTGREGWGSWFEFALLARRQEHHAYAAETELAFEPRTYQQAAGLATYYNRWKFHAAVVTREPDVGRCLRLVSCLGDAPEGDLTLTGEPVPVEPGAVALRVEVERARQRFLWRQGSGDWRPLGPDLDASLVSDEGGRGEHRSFTGAFVGMHCVDLSGQATQARFVRFSYAPREAC